MKELSLFTGMGGGIYGSMILGWDTRAYVEKEPYCQNIIQQRIDDGWFDNAPIYGDIKDFNDKYAHDYTNKIDIITGGFPCQPHSVAGKRKGRSDERYLFDQIIKTIQIVRPKQLFFENVPGILTDGTIVDIYRQLTRIGYITKRPLLLGSGDCGNIHKRKRVWLFANATSQRQRGWQNKEYRSERTICEQEKQKRREIWCEAKGCSIREIQHSHSKCKRSERCMQRPLPGKRCIQRRESIRGLEDLRNRPDIPEPLFRRVDDELPNWKQQLKAIGNGQDPIVMATAYQILNNMN